MDVKNCRQCKKLFNYLGGPPICPACKELLEEKFTKVKNYIWDNKNASIEEISEVNEVSVQQIKQWVREDRLTFSEDSPIGIECEGCGKLIKSGRYCEECKQALAHGLDSMIKKPKKMEPKKKEREKDRMRFLDKQ